jgi:hypothetical protein
MQFQQLINKIFNFQYSLNAEHSYADGPIWGHIVEEMCLDDIKR